MPSDRAIVETLNRKELLELVAHFELEVPDRRVRDNLVEAIASSRHTRIDAILGKLSLASLKDVCRKHGLDDSGRTKSQLIERILADAPRRRRAAPSSVGRSKAVASKKASPAERRPSTPVVPPKRSTASRGAKTAAAAPVAKQAAARGRKPAVAKVPKAFATAKSTAAKASVVAKAPAAAKATATAKPAAAKASSVASAKRSVVTKLEPPPKRRVAAAAKGDARRAVSLQPTSDAPAHPDRVAAAAPAQTAAPSTPRAKPSRATPKAPPPAAPPPRPQMVVNKAPRPAALAPVAAVAEAAPNLATAPLGSVKVTPQAVREALDQGPPASVPQPYFQEADYTPTTSKVQCHSCGRQIELRKCSVQRCKNMLVPNPARKICAECLFERNTLSMDEFNLRLQEEGKCPHCNDDWQHN